MKETRLIQWSRTLFVFIYPTWSVLCDRKVKTFMKKTYFGVIIICNYSTRSISCPAEVELSYGTFQIIFHQKQYTIFKKHLYYDQTGP